MHAYSLRFAPATTPKQRAIYRDLYPMARAQRDKILGSPNENEDEPAASPTPIDNPTAAFYGFDPSHLHPRPNATAQAPNPVLPPAPNPAPKP